MMISPQQRVSIAIFATLLFHTSLAYAIYEIESKVIVKEVLSSDIHLVSLDEVKKEQPSISQEKQEKKAETQLIKKVVQQKIEQKPITIKQALPLQQTKERLVVSNTQHIQIKESVEENQESDLLSTQTTEANKSEPVESYLSKVRAKIQSNIKYPLFVKKLKLEGESVIEFVILKSGYVDELSIAIKQSSGYESLDKQAIKTLLSVLPFEIPPKNNMTIILPVVFQLNKN